MNLINTNRQVIYAILLFLPTLFFASEKYYLLLPLCVFIFEYQKIKSFCLEFKTNVLSKKFVLILILPFLFILFSLINKSINGHDINCLKDYYASFYLLFPLLLVSFFVSTQKFYKVLLILIVFEIIIGLIEYFYSNISFFIDVSGGNLIKSKTILYNSRIYGLSVNSSVLALKIFAGILLIEFIKLNKYLKIAFRIFLFIGVIITFNRAVVLALFIFWIIYLIQLLIVKKSLTLVLKKLSLTVVLFFLVFYSFSKESILYQFFRGEESTEGLNYVYNTKEVLTFDDFDESCETANAIIMKEASVSVNTKDTNVSVISHKVEVLDTSGFFSKMFLSAISGVNTSGRSIIWLNYINFLDEHMLFGNGSDKVMLKSIDQTNKSIILIHAHNSYLQLFATNGLLLSIFFVVILFLNWTKRNRVLLIAILFYSLFQYGVFWGFSFLDVIFMSFLLARKDFLMDSEMKD